MLNLKRLFFKNRFGFLLLEVLVSVTIISVGLAYIVRSFSSATRAIETSRHLLKSVSLAENMMWDMEARGAMDKGWDSGRFKEDNNFFWEVETRTLKDVPLNQVSLKINWKGPREKQRVSLDTYLWNEEE